MTDAQARQLVFGLARYFADVAVDCPDNPVSNLGLQGARMWLQLLDNGDPSGEVRALVEFATPHRRHSGSTWAHFGLTLSDWVEGKGFDVEVQGLREPPRHRGGELRLTTLRKHWLGLHARIPPWRPT